ncbi:hypothetical protein F5B20DRAFT_141315 [Whalleya microplaca]|nr:hypothetical protein F5B20DRAFT_141315 [Whalleya microplaca]
MNPDTEASEIATRQGEPGTPSSLLNQKRSRNYGEQLKGLVSSGDEDDRNGLPAQKKRKRNSTGSGSGSGSESGLDDGEIVESSLLSSSIQETDGRSTSLVEKEIPRDVEPQNAEPAIREPSEDGEVNSAGDEPGPPNNPEEPFFIDSSGGKSTHPGWNQGISLGTRTSFGKGVSQAFPLSVPGQTGSTLHSATASHHSQEDEDVVIKEESPAPDTQGEDKGLAKKRKIRARSEVPSTFEASQLTWNFPLKEATEVDLTRDAPTPAFWLERLQPWIVALLQANAEKMDRLTSKVVRVGFDYHLGRKMGYLQGTKKQVNIARTTAQEAISSLDKKKLEDLVTKARNQIQGEREFSPADGQGLGGLREGDLLFDDELWQQQRYFPGAEDPSQFCLFCSGIGHRAYNCPQAGCQFCESQRHTSFGCPMRQRCDKCRQVGHDITTCQEKLALALEEQSDCAICGDGHTEMTCPEMWRSFAPVEAHRRSVKDIPAFCYNCGAQGHYGPECGLPGRGGKVTGRTTWSQANRSLYIDPDSQDIAVGWVDVDLTADFHILGRAKRQTHTHFVSSDESEEELVHAPVEKSKSRGGIRIASNIGASGQSSSRGRRGQNNGQNRGLEYAPPPPPPYNRDSGDSWQPPLPPGPPPSGNGSLPLAPSGTLPARPQTISQGGSDRGPPSNRGGRGGRGGRRGRGRGRGR